MEMNLDEIISKNLKEEIKKEEHNIDVYEENFQKEIKQRDASIKFLREFQKKKNETDKND